MDNLYNTYKNKILLKILFIGIMMFLILSYIAYLNYNSKMNHKFNELSQTLTNIISTEEDRIIKLYKSRLKKNLKSYGVIDAIRKNDSQELYELIKPRYEELIKENEHFNVMHFHTADNRSFLRMHKPNKNGDDLSSYRQIVVDTNNDKKQNAGFEKGKFGYFYRIIMPIIHKQTHLGSVEFGLKLEYFTKNLNRLLPNTDFSLMFLTKDLLIKDKNYKTLDQYSLIIDNKKLFKSFIEKIDLSKDYNIIHKNNRTYIIGSNVYIKNYKGQDTIKILFALDITDFKNNLIDQILFLFFIGGLTYIISFFLINNGFKTYINSIQEQSKKLKEYTKIIDDNVIVSSTDLKGNITYASNAFSNICGYSKNELLGHSHNIIRHDDMTKSKFENLWDTIKKGKVWEGELKNKKKNGSYYWVNAIISPIYNSENKITGYTAVRQNITDRKEVEEISQRDKLTGVYNRLKLDSVLETEVNRSKRYDSKFSVILADIDKFKNINDIYGHQVGDEVLKQMADIMSKQLRKTDVLGRWGGEEFMLICPNTSLAGAKILAEKLRKSIQNHNFKQVGIRTSSFGVSEYINGEKEQELIKRCDEALYDAKAAGRNKVIVK